MSDNNIYEKCPLCNAKRDARDQCRACDGEGYVATGVTLKQFERAMKARSLLQYVQAMRLSLAAPSPFRADGKWACYANPAKVWRAAEATAAIDLAVQAGLTKTNNAGAK